MTPRAAAAPRGADRLSEWNQWPAFELSPGLIVLTHGDHITLYLSDEFFHALKTFLSSQPSEKVQSEPLTAEGHGLVQHMGFHAWDTLLEGGLWTDIYSREAQPVIFKLCHSRVDALAGRQMWYRIQISGGETEPSTPPRPADNRPGDAIWATQHGPRHINPPFMHYRPNRRTVDGWSSR